MSYHDELSGGLQPIRTMNNEVVRDLNFKYAHFCVLEEALVQDMYASICR